jgi:hypothetical protein
MKLQLAAKYDNAKVEIKELQAAAIANRKAAIDALDALKQRILLQRPSLYAISVAVSLSGDGHGSRASRPASRNSCRKSSSPISDASLPNPVSSHAYGDSSTGLSSFLVRYFYKGSRGRNGSHTQNHDHSRGLTTENSNLSPVRRRPTRVKTPQEQALVMKDVDEIISAYQTLRVEGATKNIRRGTHWPCYKVDFSISATPWRSIETHFDCLRSFHHYPRART